MIIQNKQKFFNHYFSHEQISHLHNQAQDCVQLLFKDNLDYLDVINFFTRVDDIMSECLFTQDKLSLLFTQCFYHYLEQDIIYNIKNKNNNPLCLCLNSDDTMQLDYNSTRFLSLGLSYGVLPEKHHHDISNFYLESNSSNHPLLSQNINETENFKKDCYWDIIQNFYFIKAGDNPEDIIEEFNTKQAEIQSQIDSVVEKKYFESMID